MTDLIRRLAAVLGRVLIPTGRHRPQYEAPVFLIAPRPDPPVSLPAHRSPYGLDTPLDATAARSVRPYVGALGASWTHGLEAA
ncbi:hypothetical protein [Streptomyces sp. L2]|uniref:hypothetical protein n=1 Tax=Streptomyces sp. L2 TaxID=2162665 RepID=UPI0010111AA2|nr:hypothetical protein [Streptomyces sp. L2]